MSELKSILEFLAQISIPTKKADLDNSNFLPGILIEKGVLLYDPEKLKYPGDLIHEAGHIALMTPDERKIIVGNVNEYRTPAQDDEMGVMAWSFAALRHLGLETKVVFHEGGYKGDSQMLIQEYESGQPIGLPLLVWMDLSDYETYPEMKKWVRE